MAILMTADVSGMGNEMYSGMIAQLRDQIRSARGFVLHAGHEIEGGWRVMEVWESEADHEAWFEGTIKPNLPEGVVPDITIAPLANVVTP